MSDPRICSEKENRWKNAKNILTIEPARCILVSVDTNGGERGEIALDDPVARIESKLEVCSYLQNLRYALEHGAQVEFKIDRKVDEGRDKRHTNAYTVADLFPDEDPLYALRRELLTLTIEEYMRTVRDLRFPQRSEMREFGKVYEGKGDVYVKIRVELISKYGGSTTFVMSFHYAEKPFVPDMFPYKKKEV